MRDLASAAAAAIIPPSTSLCQKGAVISHKSKDSRTTRSTNPATRYPALVPLWSPHPTLLPHPYPFPFHCLPPASSSTALSPPTLGCALAAVHRTRKSPYVSSVVSTPARHSRAVATSFPSGSGEDQRLHTGKGRPVPSGGEKNKYTKPR